MKVNKPILASNLNSLTLACCEKILKEGNRVPSRNGACIELENQDLYLENPRNRHLYLKGRLNNIYATIAETFWVMAGKDELDPLMKFFLPRCVNFSDDDDGKTWRGAYGPRIWQHDQINHVVSQFINDGINTRRATMAIWRPDMDTNSAIMLNHGLDHTKDLPCSQHLSYWIRDGKLNCKFLIRSNDAIWGLSHINLFEFTFLQEVILELIKNAFNKNNVTVDINLGYYNHSAVSLHIYNPGPGYNQACDIVATEQGHCVFNYDTGKIDIGNLNVDGFHDFMEEIYDSFCYAINHVGDSPIHDIFEKYEVPTRNNILFQYALLVRFYISEKLGIAVDPKLVKEVLNDSSCTDLRNAVECNKFTPDEWLVK